MRQTNSLTEKLSQFWIIFFPIFITQLSLTATSFFDTVMSGNVSQYDLAGVAIAANLWMPVYTGLNGVIIGITPILAQMHGAGRQDEMAFVVVQGIYLSAAISGMVLLAGFVGIEPLFGAMALEPRVGEVARNFIYGLAIGIPPLFASAILRNFIEALGYTRVTMLIALGAVMLNVALNYLLIFGQGGFPQLGGAGAGYASAITYWCIFIVSGMVVHKVSPFREYQVFHRLFKVSPAAWKQQLAIGVPIGLAIFCEVSIFGVVGLLMAEFGTAIIAAHQAAINFATLVYMLPLSIGTALTILVGYEAGAGRYRDAGEYSLLGIGVAFLVAVFGAAGLFFFRGQVAALYTTDPEVHILLETFLLYAVFFQMSDAIAAPIQGALRGYKDVRAVMGLSMLSYWIIGMPLGFALAKWMGMGAYGYWLGLIIGLAAGACLLAARLVYRQRHPGIAG